MIGITLLPRDGVIKTLLLRSNSAEGQRKVDLKVYFNRNMAKSPYTCLCKFLPSVFLIFFLYIKNFHSIGMSNSLIDSQVVLSSERYLERLTCWEEKILIYNQSPHFNSIPFTFSNSPLTFLTYVDLFFVMHVLTTISVSFRFSIQLMFQSLLIKFSENQGVWACAVVNEKGKYFLEKPAAMPCGCAARPSELQWKHESIWSIS